MPTPHLSIVIPVYNEADNLENLYRRLTHTLDAFGKPYEILFINDGSRDATESLLEALFHRRPDILRVIHFNGNFGQHMAIMAGFERARGEIIVTLDADLQNPPEEIPTLIQAIEAGHDYVGSIRQNRQDTWFRRHASRINNAIRARITGIVMTDQGCMLRAYQRHVIDAVVASRESSVYIPALAYSYAGNPTEVMVQHCHREAGKSKYNLYKLLRLNFDLMTGFSLVPLQAFTVFGMVVSLFSTLFVIYLFIRRLLIGPEAEGMFTLFAILYFLIGVGLMGLGIVGEYIGRIYKEVRQRPFYIVRNTLEQVGETTHV
ncbi:MAG: UDP-4-amino-4-deoxy-L-arabinose-oxoglutarate aminotransferase [Gammaproteobacteria bacterium RIFCSPHIGHO2_12_FULL_45_12]|nr:MAG: UDP-4-amino-4-deoxy-L-arabinose-oxoglutarate aminotransferase [Gammaproteobacteria bacterium RIFCSPHIGHO2_12_FULL_45_12]